MKKLLLPLIILGAASSALAQTAFTGTYTFTGTTGTNNPFAYNGTDIANLTEGGLSRSNLPVSSSSSNFRSTGFALDLVTNTLTGSYDPTKFFEFSLTARSRFTLSMSNITFGLGRSGTGPRSWAWASSVDNFASFTGNYSSLGSSGLFSTNVSATNPAGALFWITDTNLTTGTNIVLNLSSLQNLTSITFRLYGWNSENTGGTGGLQGPLSFSGSLTAPLLTTNTWSGGSGTWETGQQGNFPAPYTDGTNSATVFSGSPGTVSVVGGVETATLTFSSGGFAVAGAAVTNSMGDIATDAGMTTFSSDLAGSDGLTKTGAGSLFLSGTKTFSGNVSVIAGTLQIDSDGSLGNAANDLALGGTLRTTNSISLGAGRDLSGNGTFDIANGTTLTVNGNISNTATTLANSGTLDLQGGTRSLGNITLNAPGTINAVGAISGITSLSAAGLTAGTATINQDIVFVGSATQTLDVGSGGNLALNGAVSGATFLAKTGSGTLTMNGANSVPIRIGANGNSAAVGGTVILGSAASAGSGPVQLNSGTLRAAPGLVLTNGLSIGGQTNGAAILAGSNLEFQGQSGFFKGTGTTGPSVLIVSNTTTFSGGFGASSGAGSGSGITIGGNGRMIISGDSSLLRDTITLTDTVKLTLNSSFGGSLVIGANNSLGGTGSIDGNVSLLSGAKIEFNTLNTLTVNGATVTFGNFNVGDLDGLSSSTPNGTYTIFNGLATVITNNLGNLGAGNAYDLGGGKSAYFTIGSLDLNVVPEPSTYALLVLSAAGLCARVIRRRRK